MILVLEMTSIIPFTLSSTDISAFGPPISVLTHQGCNDITDIPSGLRSIERDLTT